MKNKRILIFASVAMTLGLLISLVGDPNSISKKNVQLIIPKGFPQPYYAFENNEITPEGFVLGRSLFYDPILSRDSSISCATCHQQYAAFAHIDHKLSHGIDDRIGIRNIPALQNLIWKDNFMWDGGVNHLEIQPFSPITSKDEMDANIDDVIHVLQSNRNYKMLFQKAFGDTLVNTERIFKSLVQFTGLMISANSKYDQYLRGDINFTEAQSKGLKLFEQKCVSCHKAPLFTDNLFATNGLPIDSSLNDLGRGKITNIQSDNYKFKTPTLRNVEVTFPYMHDGSLKTLNDVLDHYSNLSNSEADISDKLKAIGKISAQEKEYLIEFLKSLTDKTFLMDRRFRIIKG